MGLGGRAHIVRSGFDLLVEFVLVLVPERRVSNQEDVKDHTYTAKHNRCVSDKKVEGCGRVGVVMGRTDEELTACPDVYGFTIRLLPQHLWRQVAGGSGEAYTHTTQKKHLAPISLRFTRLYISKRSAVGDGRRSCNQQHKNGISQTAECVREVIYREHDRGKREMEEEGGSSGCGRFSMANGRLTRNVSFCSQEGTLETQCITVQLRLTWGKQNLYVPVRT